MSETGAAQPENEESPVPNGTPELTDAQEILLRHIRKAWYEGPDGYAKRLEQDKEPAGVSD